MSTRNSLKLFSLGLIALSFLFLYSSRNQPGYSKNTVSPTTPTPSESLVTSPPPTCPAGFVRVPGDSHYQTSDFCVMKYDAKCADAADTSKGLQPLPSSACAGPGNGTYKNNGAGCACTGSRQIVSTASGYPLTYIPLDDGSATSAKAYCESNGWHVLKNAEWMTIARNLERVEANWCDRDGTHCGFPPGTPGKIISNGHNDAKPNRALEAGQDAEPCFGTTTNGSNTCGSPNSQKRTLTLSSGEVIWDLAGNVWQWVDDRILRKDEPKSATNGRIDTGWTLSDYAPGSRPSVLIDDGLLGAAAFRPSNPSWNANNGVGRIFHYSSVHDTDLTKYAIIRGGNWRHGYDSGIFNIHLTPVASKTNIDDVGFRCAAPLVL